MEAKYYKTDKECPIDDWLDGLDNSVRARIIQRFRRIENGNLGDHEPVGDGVFELRMHFGPGYRAYYGMEGQTVVILLCGGDKSSQKKDINLAKELWRDYNSK